MSKKIKFVTKSLVTAIMPFLLTALATGCRSESGGSSGGVTDIPSIGPTPSPTPDPGGSTGPATGNFEISTTLPFSTISAYLHNATSFDDNCEISSSDTDKDIDCYYDINELDLYFNTVTVGISVPQNMCDYIAVYPNWFYMAKASTGPTTLNLAQNATGTLTVTSQAPAASDLVGAATIRDGSVACETDYTYDDGPNCCTGTYTGTLTATDSTGTVSTSAISGDWGGQVGNCASGAGSDTTVWGRTTEQNLPQGKIFYGKDGLTWSYPVTSPISQGFGRNYFSANYVTNPAAPPYPLSSTYGVQVIAPPELYHTFLCLDHAWEVEARIRFMVREWNLASELAKGDLGTPDSTGTDPNFPSSNVNDRRDWDDLSPTTWPGHRGL